MTATLSAIAVAFYAFATWTLTARFRVDAGVSPTNLASVRWALPALLLHAYVLYETVFVQGGLNLGVFNVASLTAWTVATLMAIASFRRPVDTLGFAIWPLSCIAVGLAAAFPGTHVLGPALGLGVRLHVVLSILAYSLLAIAACQAVLLYVLEYQLRKKRPGVLLRTLPPLQIQEGLLIQLIGLGFFLLSLSLISGVMFVQDFLAQHLVHKTILSIVAWAVFGGLLWGRWRHGWRGRTLTRWCIAGFVVLVLAYFGSKLVLEMVLGRSWAGAAIGV